MNKHSPLPWTVRPHLPDAHFEVVADAEGNTVAQGLSPEVAAGIVEAVNYHDRLRDLVRRLADSLGVAVYALRSSVLFPGSPQEPPHDHLNGVDITALLDEARAAVGESMKEGGAV